MAEPYPPTQGRILIVDDQRNWRETLAEMLTAAGYTVQTVDSLSQARVTFPTKTFDLVILDIRLQDKDRHDLQGLEFLQDLKRASTKSRILVLTGYVSPEIEAKVKQLGTETLALKSPPEGFDIIRFRQMVDELVRQG
jgi:DNA-binding NtrC family response regulator